MRSSLAVSLALFLLGSTAVGAQDTAIYQQGGSALYDAIAGGIKTKHSGDGSPAPQGPVSVSTDPAKASQDMRGLEGKGARYFYALGPAAANLATQSPTASGVYIYIPNPTGAGLTVKPKWAGVSPYPDFNLVLQHLKGVMKIQRVAVLYTKKNNQEIAQVVNAAAGEAQVGCTLVGIKGPEELQGALGGALKQSDAVLVLLDPIAFNPDSLRFVVNTCIQEKKPAIGFADALASSGLPFAIYPPPDAIAETSVEAMKALRGGKDAQKVRYPQRFVLSVNENAAKSLGTPHDAGKVVKRY